jgi:exodeoxyribonuclease VII large subunit
VGPQATLSRGYAIVRSQDGRLIRSLQQVAVDERLLVQLADGAFTVEVIALAAE